MSNFLLWNRASKTIFNERTDLELDGLVNWKPVEGITKRHGQTLRCPYDNDIHNAVETTAFLCFPGPNLTRIRLSDSHHCTRSSLINRTRSSLIFMNLSRK